MPVISEIQSLSSRGEAAANAALPVFLDVIRNSFSSHSNPSGFLSLGLAENVWVLMHQEMEEYIAGLQLRLSSHDLTYGDGFSGSQVLRAAISRFLNRHLKPVLPINPSQIVVTAGVTNAIEATAWSLGDPGDGVLLGRPFYTAFVSDLRARAELKTVTVAFGHIDPFSLAAVGEYERALLKSHEGGTRIRALMLCSPHNPLGRCYPRDTIVALMKLCQRYQIHLISDEIYALSVWKNPEVPYAVEFTSVLAIDLTDIIDPDLVHVLWGMSKASQHLKSDDLFRDSWSIKQDFGANGLRLGCVISQSNAALLASMRSVSIFTCPSSATGYIVTRVLEDDSFTHQYIATNGLRIAESYAFITAFLRSHSIPFYPGANAAFFIWCNLKAYRSSRLKEATNGSEVADYDQEAIIDDDGTIMQKLLAKKVFIASGADFGGEEPGWFRIVFTHPRAYLEEGMKRMIEALS